MGRTTQKQQHILPLEQSFSDSVNKVRPSEMYFCDATLTAEKKSIPLFENKTNDVHYLFGFFVDDKKCLCFQKISSSESVLPAFSLLSMVIPQGTCHSWNFREDSRELVLEKCCTPRKLNLLSNKKEIQCLKKYHATLYV